MKAGCDRTFNLGDPDGLAIEALAHLAESPERLGDFLGATGFSPQSLRDAAGSPGFARGILSYMAAEEDRLLAFAAHLQVKPEKLGIAIARATGVDGFA